MSYSLSASGTAEEIALSFDEQIPHQADNQKDAAAAAAVAVADLLDDEEVFGPDKGGTFSVSVSGHVRDAADPNSAPSSLGISVSTTAPPADATPPADTATPPDSTPAPPAEATPPTDTTPPAEDSGGTL